MHSNLKIGMDFYLLHSHIHQFKNMLNTYFQYLQMHFFIIFLNSIYNLFIVISCWLLQTNLNCWGSSALYLHKCQREAVLCLQGAIWVYICSVQQPIHFQCWYNNQNSEIDIHSITRCFQLSFLLDFVVACVHLKKKPLLFTSSILRI